MVKSQPLIPKGGLTIPPADHKRRQRQGPGGGQAAGTPHFYTQDAWEHMWLCPFLLVSVRVLPPRVPDAALRGEVRPSSPSRTQAPAAANRWTGAEITPSAWSQAGGSPDAGPRQGRGRTAKSRDVSADWGGASSRRADEELLSRNSTPRIRLAHMTAELDTGSEPSDPMQTQEARRNDHVRKSKSRHSWLFKLPVTGL